MEANTVSLKTFIVSVSSVFILESAFRLAIPANIASSLPGLGLLRVTEMMVLIFIVIQLEGNLSAIGLDRSLFVAGIRKGLIWSAFFGIAAGISFTLLFFAGVNALQLFYPSLPSSLKQVVIYSLVGGLLAPIAEEIFFRGILYGFFRRWGTFAAIILSTLLFVIIHPLGRQIPVTQIIGGIVFAIAYEREKNLIVPISIHALGNLAIFSLPYIT
jgi:membrane protease YdiL (CAAX protease family)